MDGPHRTGPQVVTRLPARYAAYKASETRPGTWVEVETVRARNAREAREIVAIREWVKPSRVRVVRIDGNPIITLLRTHRLLLAGVQHDR